MFIDEKKYEGKPIIQGEKGYLEGTADCLKQCVDWIREYDFNDYLEIGSLYGVMIAFLAKAFPDKRFSAIDPYDSIVRPGNSLAGDRELKIFIGNNHFLDNVWLYRDYSRNVLPMLKEKGDRFDLIFVDGDHTHEAVLGDIAGSWEILVPSGILYFHDSPQEGIAKAIKEHSEIIGLTPMKDKDSGNNFFRKP